MRLPREELLQGCSDRQGMEDLLIQAETVLRTWQPIWSPFLGALTREESLDRMSSLIELKWHSEGGYPGAERQRLLCIRSESQSLLQEETPIKGLQVNGNFLFDRVNPCDIRKALEEMGAKPGGLGDIWIQGDRGAQLICTPETALSLKDQRGRVREVEIHCETLDISRLRLPIKRLSKKLTSVEASTRIDAIASAGFGFSRAKITRQIKEGRLRLNWKVIKQPSKELNIGDRLQLEGRGSLEVINLELTKRQRWKVEVWRK